MKVSCNHTLIGTPKLLNVSLDEVEMFSRANITFDELFVYPIY